MNLQALRKRFEPLLRRSFHLYWRFARGMTLGVRGIVVDGNDRVFLIKHSYVAGWHLPGGGVEPGESFLDALRRELAEEGCIEVLGEPVLLGMFFNSHVSRRDHVAVYRSGISARIGRPSRTVRSLPAASSKPARCRRRPPRVPACGYPRRFRARARSERGASDGKLQPY